MSNSEYHKFSLDEKRSEEDDGIFDLETRLLGNDDRGQIYQEHGKPTFWNCFRKPFLLHGLFMAINLIMASSLLYSLLHKPKEGELVYSPLSHVLSYETRNFTNDEMPLYTGPPDPAIEERWHDMLQGIDVRVTKEDLQRLGRLENAVELQDERGGYVVLLNVYHELHCLKLIRQILYPDYFYPNQSEADAAERVHHIGHCLNYLRQAAMCHGDVGISTWHWEHSSPMPQGRTTPHVCKNWDAIDSWAKERKVNLYQPGLLVHPELGVTFPNGVGTKKNPPSDGGP